MEQKNITEIEESKGQKLVLRVILLFIIISIIAHIFFFAEERINDVPALSVLIRNDFIEAAMLTILVLFLPLSSLYINVKDYYHACLSGETFSFTKSFFKQIIIILIYGLITGISIYINELDYQERGYNYSLFFLWGPSYLLG